MISGRRAGSKAASDIEILTAQRTTADMLASLLAKLCLSAYLADRTVGAVLHHHVPGLQINKSLQHRQGGGRAVTERAAGCGAEARAGVWGQQGHNGGECNPDVHWDVRAAAIAGVRRRVQQGMQWWPGSWGGKGKVQEQGCKGKVVQQPTTRRG